MKEKRLFSIFNSHLDLAHQLWRKTLQKGDWAIDATCGNGYDTLYLAENCEGVISLDIQGDALQKTKKNLLQNGVNLEKIHFFHQNHESFPSLAKKVSIKIIVYNLGYLPGGNKELTTLTASTLKSLQNALKIVLPGGLISITCYPGHAEGFKEEKAILDFCKDLSPHQWSVCFHNWINRLKSPSLFTIQKNIN